MAVIGIVVIAVVCLAVIGGIVWFALNRGSTNLPLVGSKFNDQCEQNDKELCKFLNNSQVQNNYTVKSIITNSDGTKSESTYSYDEVTVLEPSPTKDAPATPNITIPEADPSANIDYNLDYSQIPTE